MERGDMSMQSGTVARRTPWAAPRRKGGTAVRSILPPMRIPPILVPPRLPRPALCGFPNPRLGAIAWSLAALMRRKAEMLPTLTNRNLGP